METQLLAATSCVRYGPDGATSYSGFGFDYPLMISFRAIMQTLNRHVPLMIYGVRTNGLPVCGFFYGAPTRSWTESTETSRKSGQQGPPVVNLIGKQVANQLSKFGCSNLQRFHNGRKSP